MRERYGGGYRAGYQRGGGVGGNELEIGGVAGEANYDTEEHGGGVWDQGGTHGGVK